MSSPLDLAQLQERVGPRDIKAGSEARWRLDQLAKPVGSLGRLEELAAWLASVQGCCPPTPLDDVRVVVLAGDHGAAARGVSSSPLTTAATLRRVVAGDAAVTVLARLNGVGVRALDIAVDDDTSDLPDAAVAHKVRRGSGSIDVEDALSSGELAAAFEVGRSVTDEEVDSGAALLVAADLGAGGTTVASALLAALLELAPLDVVGTGAAVDDQTWARRVAVVRDATYRARPHAGDPLALIRTVGSADIAVTVGLLVQAAARRTPVLLDGLVSCVSAVAARRLVEDAGQWWLAAHRGVEPAQQRALDVLGLQPLLDLGIRLGQGTGALTALPLLRAAQALISDLGTLADPDLRPAS